MIEPFTLKLNDSEHVIAAIIPIPSHANPMARMKILQEILEELSESSELGSVEYVIQIKPKESLSVAPTLAKNDLQEEAVNLPTGKLNVPYLLKNAELLAEAAETALARNIYKTLIAAGEQVGTCHFKMGTCFEAERKLDQAAACYEEAIAYEPTLQCYERLIGVLLKMSRDESAAETAERALHMKNLSRKTRFELHKTAGNCWSRGSTKQSQDRSESHFNKALELDPTADEIRSNLGVLCLQTQRTHEAKRHFQDSVASNPKNYMALAGLGSAFLQEGDTANAHDYLCESLSIELNNPDAIFNLVKCAYELKRFAVATRLVEEFVQIGPLSPSLLFTLAGLQYHLGRTAEAKKTARKILELNSQHQGASELLRKLEST